MVFERFVIHAPVDIKLSYSLTGPTSHDVDVTPNIRNLDSLYFSDVFPGDVKVVSNVTVGNVDFDVEICDVLDS